MKETIMIWATLPAGVYLICLSMLMDTENLISFVMFKAVPFFLGLGCLYTGARLLGLI